MFIAALTNCLQMSPRAVFLFYLKMGKLNICTYKCPSDNSLFLHEGLCKIHTPFTPLFHEENITENISFVVTLVTVTYVFMLQFSSLMLVGLQKCSLV
jgi:hypothetical protein